MILTLETNRKLNPEQKDAVEFGAGPLLIIAGAGTGKTTVVTERIKYLITSGSASATEILALTFTEKASREMEERVDIALPYGTTQMWISTFHSFCDRVLRNEAINIGVDPGYTLMTEAETIQFFRRNLFTFELSYFRPLGNPTKFIAGMLTHFNRLKDEDVTPEQYLMWVSSLKKSSSSSKQKKKNGSGDTREMIAKHEELARAYGTYEERKVREGVIDYADLISQTLRVFRTRKQILTRYQEQFKFILIDEYQDTNFAQNQLAILLSGSKKNITVVGDDDQAIYRWRGAAVSNIIQFRNHFPRAKVVTLTKNYRSTKEILDRSHDLIEHNNPDRLEVVEKIDKKLGSMRRVKGSQIEVIYADRVENEGEAVGKRIKAYIESDTAHLYKDIAILVRANNHADPFVRALARYGIPYQFLGPGQLFRQAEVKDLIAYLKILYNFEDSVAMYRVLSMDWLGLLPRDLAALINHAKKYGVSLYEACESLVLRTPSNTNRIVSSFLHAETEGKIRSLITMIHKHLALVKKESAGQILYYFLQESGLLKSLASYRTPKEERSASNIARLFNKLKTYEVDHEDASVFAVVDWIELSMNLGESPLAADTDWTENNAVSILTIHAAKGLEFPVVFLVNLVAGRFPTLERREQIPIPDELVKEILPTGDFHVQEERRLFYVGMTRAKDMLYFTGSRYYGEGKREKKLSPFIPEAIGEEATRKAQASILTEMQQLSLIEWEKTGESGDALQERRSVSYLSYSQLETFTTCPLQYKYRYILRIPVPPRASLVFGDTMHKTIRAFYDMVKAGSRPTKEMLLSQYHTLWSSLGYGNKGYEDKMKKHGEHLLIGFFDNAFDPSRLPAKTEEPFKIKITPLLTLGGKIDRIDSHENGTLEIIDYKTGQAPKTKNVEKDLQLTVYALAATDCGVFGKSPDQVIVSFYFFETQEKLSSTRTPAQLTAARDEIAAMAQALEKSDLRPTPGKHCEFCEFRLICEAWS